MSAIPEGDRNIPDILRECKQLMKSKTNIQEKVKDLQISLRKAK